MPPSFNQEVAMQPVEEGNLAAHKVKLQLNCSGSRRFPDVVRTSVLFVAAEVLCFGGILV